MTNYYAYREDSKGRQPIGSKGQCLFKAKTRHKSVLIKMVHNRLGKGKFKLFTYTNLYRESTHKLVINYENEIT